MFVSLLNSDLYTTFKGIYQGKSVIIKIFTESSDENNEIDPCGSVTIFPEQIDLSKFISKTIHRIKLN